MALKAVVFDVGETLVDETRAWEAAADACGVPRFTLIALVGAAIERGESHRCAFEWLGVEPPRRAFTEGELYPDALPCVRGLRDRGVRVGAVGNMAVVHEDVIRDHVDFVSYRFWPSGSDVTESVVRPCGTYSVRMNSANFL